MRHLRAFYSIGLLFAIAVGVLIFQNCSDTMSTIDQSSSAGDYFPFAFEASVDTVSFMSCTAPDQDPTGRLFTFRVAAATSASGLGFSSAFLQKTVGWTAEERRSILLSGGGQNANAYLQLAIRESTQLGALSYAGVAFKESFLGPLDDLQIVSQMSVQNGRPSQSFLGTTLVNGVARPRFFRGSIHLPETVQGEISRYNKLLVQMEAAPLALTYASGPSSDLPLGQTANAPGRAYGRAYGLQFANAGAGEPAPRRLASVSEKDLSSGNLVGGWSCPSQYALRIATGGCADSVPGDAAGRAAYDRFRRILPAAQWAINIAGGCVMQIGAPTPSQSCYPVGAAPGTGSPVYPYHYVSICFR